MFIGVNVFNSDLYGRLIETTELKQNNGYKSNEELPTVTLILHKYLNDENAIEASIVISTYRLSILDNSHSRRSIICNFTDGYNYDPNGLINQLVLLDSAKRETFGNGYYGIQSNRFLIPVAPSLNGFPLDDLSILPMLTLYIDSAYSNFNFNIQKRIPGRLILKNEKEVEIVLTRTPTEKYFVLISSAIFLLLTFLLTYSLIKDPKGLNTIEELIAVAGYLIAIAGFRELIGISRINGSGTLEIVVILFPLLCIFGGIIYSFFKNKKRKYPAE